MDLFDVHVMHLDGGAVVHLRGELLRLMRLDSVLDVRHTG